MLIVWTRGDLNMKQQCGSFILGSCFSSIFHMIWIICSLFWKLPYFLHVLMFMALSNASKRRIVKVFQRFPSILWNQHLFIKLAKKNLQMQMNSFASPMIQCALSLLFTFKVFLSLSRLPWNPCKTWTILSHPGLWGNPLLKPAALPLTTGVSFHILCVSVGYSLHTIWCTCCENTCYTA